MCICVCVCVGGGGLCVFVCVCVRETHLWEKLVKSIGQQVMTLGQPDLHAVTVRENAACV